MNRQNDTKTLIILFSVLSPVVIWFALMLASCYEQGIKLFELLERLTVLFNSPFNISLNEHSLKTVLISLFLYLMCIGVYFSSRENRRPGEEHGSAKWGIVSQIAKRYADHKDKSKNLILSQIMRVGLDAKKHRRNLRCFVDLLII